LCQIVDSAAGWDTKRMKEEHHEWIDKLSANTKEVYRMLHPTNIDVCLLNQVCTELFVDLELSGTR
jgi:hypothetical protein